MPSLDEIAAVPSRAPAESRPGPATARRRSSPTWGSSRRRSRARNALKRDYIAAAPVPDNASAGLTGSSAIREDQFDTINDWLPIVVGRSR